MSFIRIIRLLALVLVAAVAAAQEQIVNIDGKRYIAYTVVKGDTAYSLSRAYNIPVEKFFSCNPGTAAGIRIGQVVRIPLPDVDNRSKKKKNLFETHTVKPKETLYSISRKYGISVDTILADNPEVSAASLRVGTQLLVRKSETGQTSPEQIEQQITAQSVALTALDSAASYSYHVVHQGEDAASIASRFGTTAERLAKLNDMESEDEVRYGLIIKVPKTPDEDLQQQETQTPEINAQPRVLSAGDRARIALLLPFSQEHKSQNGFVDFYQGYLMGLDEIRRRGIDVELKVFNTGRSEDTVRALVEQGKLDDVDLIIGPVYENCLQAVVPFAQSRGVMVVSPLANVISTSSRNVFQMSPKPQSKYAKLAGVLDDAQIVVISSGEDDKQFKAEIMEQIAGRSYTTHSYHYQKPGEETSVSDFSHYLNSGRRTVFVVLAATETGVDRVLSSIASTVLSMGGRSMNVAEFSVVGNSKWNRYANIDRNIFFKDNIIMFSTYHAHRESTIIQEFDQKYIREFSNLPSLYSYRGYDAAVIFTEQLYSDFRSRITSMRFCPLQTPYSFCEDPQSGLTVNSEWVRVDYRSNYTIQTE